MIVTVYNVSGHLYFGFFICWKGLRMITQQAKALLRQANATKTLKILLSALIKYMSRKKPVSKSSLCDGQTTSINSHTVANTLFKSLNFLLIKTPPHMKM